MLILSLESSAKAASAAICEDEKLISQYFQNNGLTHSRTLLVMVEDMLKNTGLTMSEIDTVAVAAGPGSFTGIRIGIAAAKGLAWGADKPIYGVSTLFAMAHHIQDENVCICPVMDARRSEVYNAKFEIRDGQLIRLCPDRAITLSDLLLEAQQDDKPYYLLGDGAQMCYARFAELSIPVRIAPTPLLHQSAWGVAIAAKIGPHISVDQPNYLRLSQAERERLEKGSV